MNLVNTQSPFYHVFEEQKILHINEIIYFNPKSAPQVLNYFQKKVQEIKKSMKNPICDPQYIPTLERNQKNEGPISFQKNFNYHNGLILINWVVLSIFNIVESIPYFIQIT
ncbi:unnamed protein product [Paramecium octaurelia]|uniref:Uncharacterized protein n=1 Tax=Paramecium octaurelia TaxID=43137 RepID=A0A8S1W129_PAROT|nr:unnamed protein product [Paramecium octaurelia]